MRVEPDDPISHDLRANPAEEADSLLHFEIVNHKLTEVPEDASSRQHHCSHGHDRAGPTNNNHLEVE